MAITTPTATCADCDIGWRGPNAHQAGEDHSIQAKHVVWYDETEGDWPDAGPFRVIWVKVGDRPCG